MHRLTPTTTISSVAAPARRLAALLTLVLALCAALGLSLASEARAGRIVDWACGGAALDGWDTTTSSPGVTISNTCSSTGGRFGISTGGSLPAHANGTWFYKAGADETVTGVQVMRGFVSNPPSVTAYTLFRGDAVFDNQHILETCWGPLGCTELAPDWANAQGLAGTDGVTILLEGCASNASCGAGTATEASLRMQAAGVTLEDDSRPVVSSIAGSLAAGEPLVGDAKLSFAASDSGTGLFMVHTLVDGADADTHVIDDNNGNCHFFGGPATTTFPFPPLVNGIRFFSTQVPCALSANVSTTVDTTTLADGNHHVVVTIDDAAGNDVTVLDTTIETENHPVPTNSPQGLAKWTPDSPVITPHPGNTLTIDPGKWTPTTGVTFAYRFERCPAAGGACIPVVTSDNLSYVVKTSDVGFELRGAVIATNSAGSTTATLPLTGQVTDPSRSNGGLIPKGGGTDGSGTGIIDVPNGVCDGARAKVTAKLGKKTIITVNFGKATKLAITLTCLSTHRPISSAGLTISSRATNALRASVRAVKTDAKGQVTVALPRGSSRTITVGWRATTAAKNYAAWTTAKLRVRAKLSIKTTRLRRPKGQVLCATASRRIRNKQRICLTGTVPKAPRGLVLDVQARDGRRWRTFDHTRVGRRGRYAYAYKFSRVTAAPATFRMRIVIAPGQKWPYVPVTSKVIGVYVAP